MLADTHSPPFTHYQANFEDFFDLDLLAGVHGATPSGSSSSSRSLPPTPEEPVLHMIPEEHDSLFNFNFDDDYLKTDPLIAHIQPPFDFLNAMALTTSPSSINHSSHSQSSTTSGSPAYLAIDPQLVGTPAPSKAQSEATDDDHNDRKRDREEEDEDEEDNDDLSLPPTKVGGSAKNRRSVVPSGSAIKKLSISSSRDKKENLDKDDDDDWRPSPEEYAKMSSKEKRQLRNKISARNFRVRRKEYIHTLEGDIAERDRLLDTIRSELGSTKSENYALRQEVAALKKAILEGRASPMLSQPAPLSPVSPVIRSSSPLYTANTQKDLPSSPHGASRAFWGGSQTFGGITSVHTTLIPDYSVSPILSGKPQATLPTHRTFTPLLQENMNPALNNVGLGLGLSSSPLSPSPFVKAPLQTNQQQNSVAPAPGFDSFTEMNPFTLKTLDMYRMQLWGKMASQNQQRDQLKLNNNTTNVNANALSGLASNMRPHYFTTALTGKQGVLTSSTSRFSYSTSSAVNTQHAMVAALASQTFVQKMGAAFWDAFSGSGSPTNSSNKLASGCWDAEKVRKVLEGKAVLRVVDIEPPKPAAPRSPVLMPKKLSSPTLSPSPTDLLEKSMSSLSLNQSKTSDKESSFLNCVVRPLGAVSLKK